jgi:hypothetical protein
MAKYFALSDLLGSSHGLALRNIKFYYNPVTSLLEPIGYDYHAGIQSAGKLIGSGHKYWELANENNTKVLWEDSFFRDKLFYREYVNALSEISEEGWVEEILDKYKNEYTHNKLLLIANDPSFKDDSIAVLFENQRLIQSYLTPKKAIEAYGKFVGQDSIDLFISNIHLLPIELKNIKISSGEHLFGDSIFVLEAHTPYSDKDYKFLRVPYENGTSTINVAMIFEYSIFGQNQTISEESMIEIKSHNRKYDSIYNFPALSSKYVNTDSANMTITFAPGVHFITENSYIQKGYKVLCHENTTIILNEGAKIISSSPFIFKGEKDKPIVVESSDRTGQGIVIINCQDTSSFSYVIFNNLVSPKIKGMALTGSITLYESPVKFDQCSFNNNKSEDCLNIIRTNYSISNSSFLNVFRDALDSDYSTGQINNVYFNNSGNDCLDLSGSNVFADSIFIEYAGDKAISIGENSTIELNHITITNSKYGIVSKDKSKIYGGDINISKCEVALMAFQKKSEYGPGIIEVEDVKITDTVSLFFLEDGSMILLNGKILPVNAVNLAQSIYGE